MIDLKSWLLLCSAVLFLAPVCAGSTRLQKRASELSDAFKGRDVNKTVAKVEAILAKNPSLPRLTRGEILALFENITKTDALKKKQEPGMNTASSDGKKPEKEKSLMVVLPFNTNSDQNQGLEELYTRQPVTRIVDVESTAATAPTTSTTTLRPKRNKKRKQGTRRKPANQEVRPVYVAEMKTTTSQPLIADVEWKPMVDNEGHSTKKKQHPNSGIDVPQHMQDTLDAFQNSNNQVFVTVPSYSPTPKTKVQTEVKSTESSTQLPNISVAAQGLTPELKNLLVSLGLLNPDGTQVSMPLKAATNTERPPPPLIQYISINPTVDPASYVVFKPLPIATSRGSNRGNKEDALSDDMRHFLASFGLTSDNESYRSQKSLISEDKQNTSTLTTSTTTTFSPLKSSEKSSIELTKDDSSLPDINTDILTDDMKDVLENIGLMKKSRKRSKGVIFNPAMRTAGLLNQSEEKQKVDKLLNTIKELSEAEKNKSLSAEQVAEQLQNITASLVEDSKEEDNSDFELVEGEGSEMNYEGYEPAEEELLKLQNGYVDDDLNDDSPLDLVDKENSNNSNNILLYNIDVKDVDNNIDKNKSKHSLKDSHNPPDPLSPEEINHFIENSKNEVKRRQPKNKRQQPINVTESSTNGSSVAKSPSTEFPASLSESSSDEPKSNSDSSDSFSPNDSALPASADSAASAAGDSSSDQDDTSPSTDDLIDSFGGDNPPENRPNGLYFLVDWNTFLRVGTDNKTVDLNFSPKVGDPKNFLPVTVP